jgi:hypothetical protein
MNRFLRLRVPDPRTWTPDEVRSLVAAAYLGDYSEGNREAYGERGFMSTYGNHGRAAVVFHLPEKMMPRRTLREFRRRMTALGRHIGGMRSFGLRTTSTSR